jgi:hypothetical protein
MQAAELRYTIGLKIYETFMATELKWLVLQKYARSFNNILTPSTAKTSSIISFNASIAPPPQPKEEYNSAAFGRANVKCSLQSHMATNLETSLVSVSAAVVVVVVMVVFSLFFESEGMNYHENIAACCCLVVVVLLLCLKFRFLVGP